MNRGLGFQVGGPAVEWVKATQRVRSGGVVGATAEIGGKRITPKCASATRAFSIVMRLCPATFCRCAALLHAHTQACTASCMAKNKAGHSPIDVAAAAGRGEVLNAMLLACSGVWAEDPALPAHCRLRVMSHHTPGVCV